MTTLNPPEPNSDRINLSALQELPRDAGGPVFAAPWQARAFALAVTLSDQGYFTWKEWAAVLAEELQAATKSGKQDDGSGYYEVWLLALERIVTTRGIADHAAMLARKAEWAEAYRRTPHGKPVELAAAIDGTQES
jgi:nitrile hydratase accessory protein